jgi:fluoride exporter
MIWFVGLGGIFGALSRYSLGKWVTSKIVTTFPLGTWIINISGAFALGILVYMHTHHLLLEWAWNLLGVGYLGAYTTFSTFGYETLQLMEKRDYLKAVYYVFSSVLLGISFAWFGSLLGQLFI